VQLKKILNNKVVVGHSLAEDFTHLKLTTSEYQCEFRDISKFSGFMRRKLGTHPDDSFESSLTSSSEFLKQIESGRMQKRKLKELSAEFLNARIQTGHHSSIIDARIALALYRNFQ
jgi:hypothetical protein